MISWYGDFVARAVLSLTVPLELLKMSFVRTYMYDSYERTI